MLFRAVVEVLIEADEEAGACDGMTAILTEQLQKYAPQSCLLDWQYVEHFEESDGARFDEYEGNKNENS